MLLKESALVEKGREAKDLHNLASLDLPPVLSLNKAHAKETSALDEDSLAALLGMAFYARGIDRGATAFLIALDHNAAYENPNFAWFNASRQPFVYIDRVVVAESARGRGIAKLLYMDLFVAAKRAGHNRVVCEVNIDPPNPASNAFHVAMGFNEVGEAIIHNGTRIVRYFEKLLG
jgi:predicted GNAT superfamily acetyltransferase